MSVVVLRELGVVFLYASCLNREDQHRGHAPGINNQLAVT